MIVDLRSDTVTKPTPEMLEAMLNAPLGDDVLGDDPTVAALEKLAAQMMGKEAALFVPSGTMGNQIAVRMWTNEGEGIILEQDSHIIFNESGAIGAHAGIVMWTLPSNRGVMDPDAVRGRITAGTMHTPRTTLLCLENPHNRSGGTTVPIALMREYRAIADEHGMKIHLDGSRIFNAAAFLQVQAKEIAQYADSVMFCLSKGLCCPIGSLIAGPGDTVQRARWLRKRLGGGMRQAGLLAACGIYALNNLTTRVAEDHLRARSFAEHLSHTPGFSVDLESVQTSIVGADVPNAAVWQSQLMEKGVLCLPVNDKRLRFVFHREIDDEKLAYAKNVATNVANAMQPALS
jgi:threonine aldolase